jgi:hypothetical protein
MKVAVVARTDLDMKDGRAEHYMPVTPTDLVAAKLAGWDSGCSGHGLDPHSPWLHHGRKEVHAAYLEGRARGVQARAEFFQTLGGAR